MPRHHQVEVLLDEAELEEFRAFAREPGRTIDELHQWMIERGFTLARSAVGNWKREYDKELIEERFNNSGKLAQAITDVAQREGVVGISKAAILQLGQVIFEQSSRMQADGELDSLDVRRYTASIKSLMDSQKLVDEIKDEYERKKIAAVAAGEKQAKTGASGADVVDTIKKALGIG